MLRISPAGSPWTNARYLRIATVWGPLLAGVARDPGLRRS
jgi:hypothetical protein